MQRAETGAAVDQAASAIHATAKLISNHDPDKKLCFVLIYAINKINLPIYVLLGIVMGLPWILNAYEIYESNNGCFARFACLIPGSAHAQTYACELN